jgi:hypothetical protein
MFSLSTFICKENLNTQEKKIRCTQQIFASEIPVPMQCQCVIKFASIQKGSFFLKTVS